jgi:hypothetical protein
MNNLFSKIMTIISYTFCAITWDDITKLLAIVLTICMITFYVFKIRNERLTTKKIKQELNPK